MGWCCLPAAGVGDAERYETGVFAPVEVMPSGGRGGALGDGASAVNVPGGHLCEDAPLAGHWFRCDRPDTAGPTGCTTQLHTDPGWGLAERP